MPEGNQKKDQRREYIWRVVVAIAIAAAVVVAALAIRILLLVFAGILLAILLRALSVPVAQRTPLSERVALSGLLIFIVALIAAGGVVVAPQLAEQWQEVREGIPEAVEQVEEFLEEQGLENFFQPGEEQQGGMMDMITGFLAGLSLLTAYLLTVLFVGLFVAYHPGLYRNGFLQLVPADYRDEMRELTADLGSTLRWWLIGRAIAMLLVGVSTFILLTALGVPLALFVSVLTGLLTFIPYLGPVLGMIPVTMAGLLEDPTIALYALGIYFIIENIEGYALDPLIQQKMVYLPPALTVAVQIGMGVLIGPLGIAMATPFAAVALVVVQKTYVEKRP